MSRLSGVVVALLLIGVGVAGCEFLGLEAETGVSVVQHPEASELQREVKDHPNLYPRSEIAIAGDTVRLKGFRVDGPDTVNTTLTMVDRDESLPDYIGYTDERGHDLVRGEIQIAEWNLDGWLIGRVKGDFRGLPSGELTYFFVAHGDQ